MLIMVEPVSMCVTCLFCVVVSNDTDGSKKREKNVGRCHVAVGVEWW